MRDEQRSNVGGPDPAAIRSIAVTVDDAAAAVEAAQRGRSRLVLRITPPFYGRMRARIHREGGEGSYDGDSDADPIHLDPETLVGDDAPAYPDIDETEDRLRETGAYDVETHRERYAAAVDEWREAIRTHLVDSLTIETSDGQHDIEVKRLG